MCVTAERRIQSINITHQFLPVTSQVYHVLDFWLIVYFKKTQEQKILACVSFCQKLFNRFKLHARIDPAFQHQKYGMMRKKNESPKLHASTVFLSYSY